MQVTFSSAAAFSCLTAMSVFVKLTPGNLGISEAFAAASASMLGIGAENGLAAALVLRACNLLVVLGLTPYYSYRLSTGAKKNLFKANN